MKMRKIMAGALALAMVASSAATAVSAVDYDWGTWNISGITGEWTAEDQVVDGDGNDPYKDGSANRLRPDSTYYIILGSSALYQNYATYENYIKVKVSTTTGGQYLKAGSVKLVEKAFGGRINNRMTAVEFKTAPDMTDSEYTVAFNIEFGARKNIDMAVRESFPIVVKESAVDWTTYTESSINSDTARTNYTTYDNQYNTLTTLKANIAAAKVAYQALATSAAPTGAVKWGVKENEPSLSTAQHIAYLKAANKVLLTLEGTAAAIDGNIPTPKYDNLLVNIKKSADVVALQDLLDAVYDATLSVTTNTSLLDADIATLKAKRNGVDYVGVGTGLNQDIVRGTTYLRSGDKIVIPAKIFVKNEIITGTDATLTAGTGKQFFSVTKNEWNEVIWEDADNEIARLYFHADSNTNGFYSQLKTTWSNEWYRQYFAHSDAYKFEFVGVPAISTTHRATLSMYMPFLDGNGYTKAGINPEDVYIYRINDDGTIQDMSEYFVYNTDNNGQGWYSADTRVISTYVISESPANMPEEEVEVVPMDDVKVPANTGR